MNETDLGRYRPYPEYKDSGVEWIEKVPEHWVIEKAPWVLDIGSGTTPKSENDEYYNGDIAWITTSELRETVITETKKSLSSKALQDYSSLKLHPKGSLAIAMYGATIGRLGILGLDATVNQACCVYSNPKGVVVKYLFYWFQMYRPYLISLSSGGGQPNLSQDLLRSVRIPLPPLPEQRAIAAFLDRETARIDELIAYKQRLIELLQEKRSALITQAVTQGLDPDVEMKDSGVEWLGRVPKHWEVVQSRRLFTQRKTKAFPSDQQLTAAQKYGVIYQDEFMELEGRRVVQVVKGGDILKHVEPNDFVISMRSFQGGIEACKFRGSISSAYVVLIPSERVDFDFFSYLFKSQQYIQALQSTTNLVRDGQALRYANFVIVDLPILPLDEQRRIASYLTEEMQRIDDLVEKSEQLIEIVKEYRTALISAVVTGKIDVRDPSPTLPSQGRETTVGRGWGEKRPA